MNTENQIIKLLREKSCTKQDVYRQTKRIFNDFQKILQKKALQFRKQINKIDKNVEINYSSNRAFEAQLKFSGDTLLFHMHSNVFDFPKSHSIHKTKYVKKEKLRSFCGVIQIYNFLSDSLKYNRFNDERYLIAHVFINKDYHFFVEKEKQLGFLFTDFVTKEINKQEIEKIIDIAIIFSLSFDLYTPKFHDVKTVSVHHILEINNNQKIKTTKKLGFKFSNEN